MKNKIKEWEEKDGGKEEEEEEKEQDENERRLENLVKKCRFSGRFLASKDTCIKILRTRHKKTQTTPRILLKRISSYLTIFLSILYRPTLGL